jgi:hypothetical protein
MQVLVSATQIQRIAYGDHNAATHRIILVKHVEMLLMSLRLTTRLPYHLSTPHGPTPDNSSHIHMYTKVLYHTARVLPRLSARTRISMVRLRPE